MIQSFENLPVGLSAAVLGDAVSEVSVSNKNPQMIKFHEVVSKSQNMNREKQLYIHPLCDTKTNGIPKTNKQQQQQIKIKQTKIKQTNKKVFGMF